MKKVNKTKSKINMKARVASYRKRLSRQIIERQHERKRTCFVDSLKQIFMAVLIEMGGASSAAEVQKWVYMLMRRDGVLREKDYGYNGAGWVNWKDSCRSAKQTMVKRGLLYEHSPRAHWDLTPEGRAIAETLRKYMRDSPGEINQSCFKKVEKEIEEN